MDSSLLAQVLLSPRSAINIWCCRMSPCKPQGGNGAMGQLITHRLEKKKTPLNPRAQPSTTPNPSRAVPRPAAGSQHLAALLSPQDSVVFPQCSQCFTPSPPAVSAPCVHFCANQPKTSIFCCPHASQMVLSGYFKDYYAVLA